MYDQKVTLPAASEAFVLYLVNIKRNSLNLIFFCFILEIERFSCILAWLTVTFLPEYEFGPQKVKCNLGKVMKWDKTANRNFETSVFSDPDWIRIQSGQWIQIRIQEGKNDPKNRKKWRNLMLWSAGCSLLRAEGFSCSLDVLYEGLGISRLQFL